MEDEQRYFMMCTMYNCHTDWHHITCQINQEENTSALCSVFAQSVSVSVQFCSVHVQKLS